MFDHLANCAIVNGLMHDTGPCDVLLVPVAFITLVLVFVLGFMLGSFRRRGARTTDTPAPQTARGPDY